MTAIQPPPAAPRAGLTRFQLPQPVPARDVTIPWMMGNVLGSLCEGKSNKGIGVDWGIAEDTVKTHIRRLLRALDARDRLHAVVLVTSGAVTVWVKPEPGRIGLAQPLQPRRLSPAGRN